MSSSYMVKDSGGGDFEPIPSGLHLGVCYAVIDIGTQPQFGNFPARRKTLFIWELPLVRGDFEKDGVKKNLPRAISEKFTTSLASKGNMRPMLESWRGRAFTEKELEGFDLSTVAGANCYLNVIHEKGKGDKANRTYANISSVNPLPRNVKKIKPENPIVVFYMADDVRGEYIIPKGIPEWVEGLIKQSEEYKAAQGASNHPEQGRGTEQTAGEDDDSVPF